MKNTYTKLFKLGLTMFVLTSLIVGGILSLIYTKLNPTNNITTVVKDTVYLTPPVVKIVDTVKIVTPTKVETQKLIIQPLKQKLDTTSKIVYIDTLK